MKSSPTREPLETGSSYTTQARPRLIYPVSFLGTATKATAIRFRQARGSPQVATTFLKRRLSVLPWTVATAFASSTETQHRLTPTHGPLTPRPPTDVARTVPAPSRQQRVSPKGVPTAVPAMHSRGQARPKSR